MRSYFIIFVLIAFCILILSASATDKPAPKDKPKTEPNLKDFKKHVRPFLKDNCYKCHSGEKKKKDLDLEKIDADMIKGDDTEKWRTVFERLRTKEMPPEKEPRPDEKKQKRVMDWINGELKKLPDKK